MICPQACLHFYRVVFGSCLILCGPFCISRFWFSLLFRYVLRPFVRRSFFFTVCCVFLWVSSFCLCWPPSIPLVPGFVLIPLVVYFSVGFVVCDVFQTIIWCFIDLSCFCVLVVSFSVLCCRSVCLCSFCQVFGLSSFFWALRSVCVLFCPQCFLNEVSCFSFCLSVVPPLCISLLVSFALMGRYLCPPLWLQCFVWFLILGRSDFVWRSFSRPVFLSIGRLPFCLSVSLCSIVLSVVWSFFHAFCPSFRVSVVPSVLVLVLVMWVVCFLPFVLSVVGCLFVSYNRSSVFVRRCSSSLFSIDFVVACFWHSAVRSVLLGLLHVYVCRSSFFLDLCAVLFCSVLFLSVCRSFCLSLFVSFVRLLFLLLRVLCFVVSFRRCSSVRSGRSFFFLPVFHYCVLPLSFRWVVVLQFDRSFCIVVVRSLFCLFVGLLIVSLFCVCCLSCIRCVVLSFGRSFVRSVSLFVVRFVCRPAGLYLPFRPVPFMTLCLAFFQSSVRSFFLSFVLPLLLQLSSCRVFPYVLLFLPAVFLVCFLSVVLSFFLSFFRCDGL